MNETTLRDQIAMAAMSAMIQSEDIVENQHKIAIMAYMLADAMMAERQGSEYISPTGIRHNPKPRDEESPF